MVDYGEYKSRNDLTKDELLAALNQMQNMKQRTDRAGRLDTSELSPLNVYCLIVSANGLNLPYITALTAAESMNCSKEFRDDMAELSAKFLNNIKMIQNDIVSVLEKQREIITQEELNLLERLKHVL